MDNQQNTEPILSQPSIEAPVKIGHAHKFILGYFALIILVAALAVIYSWQHSKVDSLSKQIVSLKTSVSTSDIKNEQSTTVETDTLPDGTKITYPLTSGNANVIWWTDGNDAPSSDNIPFDGYLRVSDKRIVEFLSTIPTDTIQNICSDEWDDETGFNMGDYQPSTKTLYLHNQYANCIQLVAADTGGKYATQAKQVIKDSTNDLNAWAKSITYSK